MKFTLETLEYADIWWLLMLLSPFSAETPCQTVWSVPACLFWVLFTPQAVCLLPLSRQLGFTQQQHELLCAEERPSSVNTWLSLHVHSHLIMGEALSSEWFQYVREAQ